TLVISTLIKIFFDRSILDLIPIWWDEVLYWIEINSFVNVGFQGGFTSVNEWGAPAAFLHFGAHGPAYPILYGFLATLFGWRNYSAPIFHLALIGIAASTWIAACRPRLIQLISAAFIIATFYPLLLYAPSTMQEGLHFALAIAFASCFQ